MIPDNLFYTKEHEWAKIDGNIVTVGITDHAQEALGEITYFELPQAGIEITAGKEIGTAESSKAASDVYSPVSGKIVEVNQNLSSTPELLNQDCYGNGWICRIQTTGKLSTGNLMDSKGYEQYLKENE